MFQLLTPIGIRLVLVCLPVAITQASDAPERGKPAALAVLPADYAGPVVIPIKYADPEQIAMTLNQVLMYVRSSFVHQPSAVILMAPEDILQKAKKLVAELDVPPASEQRGPAAVEIALIHLSNREPTQVAGQLMQALGKADITIAADRDRNALIVRGPQDVIRQMRELVTQLDTASPTVQLDFAFFTATKQPQGGTEIPDDLKVVAGELERFGHLNLRGRMSTVAVEGAEFRIDGHISGVVDADIRGMLQSPASSDVFRIKLKAEVESHSRATEPEAPGQTAGHAPAPRRTGRYSLETTVVAKPHTYIALGTAPCSDASGESAAGILVMQVRN